MKRVNDERISCCVDCPHVREFDLPGTDSYTAATRLGCELMDNRAIGTFWTSHLFPLARQRGIPEWCPLPDDESRPG
jgi:hypothetical protein